MKSFFSVLVLVVLCLFVCGSVLASSGGVPMDWLGKKQAPKETPQGQVKPAPVQKAVIQQPSPGKGPSSTAIPEEVRKQRLLVGRKRKLLNDTEWEVSLIPLDGKGRKKKDLIVFFESKVSTKSLIEQDYQPTNYSVTLKDDDKVVWETMQTGKDGEVVFFKGEVTPEFDKMSGVVSFQKLEGTENYSFISTSVEKVVVEEVVEETE